MLWCWRPAGDLVCANQLRPNFASNLRRFRQFGCTAQRGVRTGRPARLIIAATHILSVPVLMHALAFFNTEVVAERSINSNGLASLAVNGNYRIHGRPLRKSFRGMRKRLRPEDRQGARNPERTPEFAGCLFRNSPDSVIIERRRLRSINEDCLHSTFISFSEGPAGPLRPSRRRCPRCLPSGSIRDQR
jgi:hypothetical protein